MNDRLRKQLESIGGVSFEDALVLERIPPSAEVDGIRGREGPFIVGVSDASGVAERYLAGAAITESGTLTIDGKKVAIHRLTPPVRIQGLDHKIPEGPDAVRRREEWFRRRRGSGGSGGDDKPSES